MQVPAPFLSLFYLNEERAIPGFWEIQNQYSVIGCILHTDNTTMAWAFGFRNLQFPGEFIGLAGMPFDHARNAASMKALEVGATHLFFLDSDVIPPRDAVLRLLAHNQPIISGMYCRRSPPASVPVMLKNNQWITQFPQGKVIEVDLVGAGCLLIQRDVLANLPPQRPGKHWFDWRVDLPDLQGQGLRPLSEDFTFCEHARKHGYKILVDTSIKCRHVGFAQADYGVFEPLNATNQT